MSVKIDSAKILTIGELAAHGSEESDVVIENFGIPEYQRPYKWRKKNVSELISDIKYAREKGKPKYRLGTIVLHYNKGGENAANSTNNRKYQIVDGQQRLVTITLMMKELGNQNVEKFYDNTFRHPDSEKNIIRNYRYIRSKIDEIEKLSNYIMNQCEVVVVIIDKIEEAFQFFDTQNSCGKDLSTCDMLKAFHLAEMPRKMDNEEKELLKKWLETESSMRDKIFNTLCRIKKWSIGEKNWCLDDNIIETFYGVKEEDIQRFPCYIQLRENTKTEPFLQILSEFCRGRQFFEYFKKYKRLYHRVSSGETNDSSWQDTPEYRVQYNPSMYYGTGFDYIRELFEAMLLLYLDRFEENEVKSIACKIFRACYIIRNQGKVKAESIINLGVDRNGLLKRIAYAKDIESIEKYEDRHIKNYDNMPQSDDWKEIIQHWENE